jgi:catechol 2,3-dioxygenase-like lactoylglutathione lyase family enzyme
MPRSVHHVNLSVPEDGAQTEADWLVEMLGYREVSGGSEITEIVEKMDRRLWWFEADDGSQVHLSPNPEHAIVPRVHTAIRLDGDLDPALGRLGAAGFEHRVTAFDGERHAFVTDPSGNVWELVGP